MPESALAAPKEKRLSGRQWFESGRAAAVCYSYLTILPSHIIISWIYILNAQESVETKSSCRPVSKLGLVHKQWITNCPLSFPQKGAAPVTEGSDEEDVEDIDFDDDDFEGDSPSPIPEIPLLMNEDCS